MRADRLVSLTLILRRRGRTTAADLADELGVSTRTVLRDIDALSLAGVPVYAERGRHGGFSLLSGFRTELAGLSHDEALALLTAGSAKGEQVFGLSGALASAMRKVVDALPESSRATLDDAAGRLLVEPETDLLSRRRPGEDVAGDVMRDVRRAVLTGCKLRFRYAAPEKEPRWRTVDPVGLVTVRDRTYLLALKAGEDRTYRVSRIVAAEVLAEPADRPPQVDLDRMWAQRAERFLSENHLAVKIDVVTARRDELVSHARAVTSERAASGGRTRLDLEFEDLRHAVWAVWPFGTDAYVLAPPTLRAAISDRAAELAAAYQD